MDGLVELIDAQNDLYEQRQELGQQNNEDMNNVLKKMSGVIDSNLE